MEIFGGTQIFGGNDNNNPPPITEDRWLPWYFISNIQEITIPEFKEHSIHQYLQLDGTLINEGRLVID